MALTQVSTNGVKDGSLKNADIASDAAVALSKLSISGTGSSSNFLRGDGSWQAVPAGISLSGSTDNTIATVTGSNALQGEANLTYDGNNLQHSIDSAGEGIRIKATGDHWTGFYGNSNRSSADTWLASLIGQWNNTTVGQIAIMSGADTTNKDDGRIAFYTSASDGNDPVERMRIDESGNIGINQTNPSAYGKFVVNGTGNVISLRASSGAGSLGFFEGGTGRFYIKTLNGSDGLSFVDGDGSSERFRITAAGHLQLQGGTVYGDDSATATFKLQSTSGNNNHARIEIGTIQSSDNGGIHFYTAGSSAATRYMTLKGGGNLGIGVDNPSTTLHLDSTGATTTLQIDSDTESSIDFNDHGGSAKRYKIGTNISDNSGQFEIKDMTASVERFRIDSSGRLLSGTTTAGQSGEADALTLYRNAHTGITIRTGTSHQGSIYFADGTTTDQNYRGTISYDHSTDSLTFKSAATEKLKIDNSAIYVKSGFPLAFLASSGPTPNIKSGGASNQDLLFTSGSGNPERLRIASGGDVNIKGGILNLGEANTSSGHINSYEVLTFNIDTDNDDTNRYFGFYKDGATSSGTCLFKIQEDEKVGFGLSSPQTSLHVSQVDAGLWLGNPLGDGFSSGQVPTLKMYSDCSEKKAFIDVMWGGDNAFDRNITFGGSNLILHSPGGNNGTEALKIEGDRVQVGRDNPGSLLTTDLSIRGRYVNDVGDFSRLYFRNSSDSGSSTASIRARRFGDNYGTELTFYTQQYGGSSGGDGSARARITNNGATLQRVPVFASKITYDGSQTQAKGIQGLGGVYINEFNGMSDANDRFVAPYDGFYFLTFYTNIWKSSSGSVVIKWYKNGSAYSDSTHGTAVYQTHAGGGGWEHMSSQIVIELDANDYVQIYRDTTNIRLDGGTYGHVGGFLISAQTSAFS